MSGPTIMGEWTMETLEQWREQKRRQAMARRFRKNAGLGIALLGLILTFLSVPITGPMQPGLICMGLVVFVFGFWVAMS